MSVVNEIERLTRDELESLARDSKRYRWLRDNGHLDIWWSVEGPEEKSKNIDADIDEAIKESES
jgi:hypothetical protein